jgi:hypothetical protein
MCTVGMEQIDNINALCCTGDVKHLWFTSLELSCYEDQITDKHVLVYEDARKVFVDAQKWLAKAKQYYTLDEHASDCVQIVQDLSQLYKYLAFFEEDEKRYDVRK